jgi:dTDP-4-dehydrorhamnose 3,5-epimerase-like enzyme
MGVNPLDPELGISWPIPPSPDDPTMMSVKDASAPRFSEL